MNKIIICVLFFYSGIFLNGKCIAQSSLSAPAAPVIDSVSVDPVSGLAEMAWTQNPNADVNQFKIYKYDATQSPPWVELLVVNGGTSTFTVIAGSNPGQGSELYGISAFDFSGAPTFSVLPHRTIFLAASYSNCKLQTSLVWNKYINWANGVKEYKILASENGGPYTVVGTTNSSDTVFVHSNLTPLSQYDYIIRAVENGSTKSSSSNKKTIMADYPIKPTFNYLAYVTVKSDKEIELSCEIDTLAEIEKYIIQRKESTGSLTTIKTILASSITGTNIKFNDITVDAKMKSYTYVVKAIDFCGGEAYASELNNSMRLKGENFPEEMSNTIKWNEYINWAGGTFEYNIYRSVNGEFDTNPVASLPAGTTEFTESLDELFYTNGEFCYYIEAVEGTGNPNWTKSLSNKICLIQHPYIYAPSAFKPSGINSVFAPVFSYVDPLNYNLTIYDRWGHFIFESPELYTGWDGKINGADAPEGVYIYYINYSTALGTSQGKSGSVLLLK